MEPEEKEKLKNSQLYKKKLAQIKRSKSTTYAFYL